MRFAPGWLSLALACGLTVVPYGIDMLAGSVLTPLSVIGPEPRSRRPLLRDRQRTRIDPDDPHLDRDRGGPDLLGNCRAAGQRSTFLVVGLISTVVFAAGRFGADVGAAIVFPVAAVVAAAIAVGRPRLAWAGLAVAAAALALLAVADIVTGSETHFVRSVVGGSGGSFIDVIGHRLDATLESFTRLSRIPVTVAALAVIALGVWKRELIGTWLEDLPADQGRNRRRSRWLAGWCCDQRFRGTFHPGRNALSGTGTGIRVDCGEITSFRGLTAPR